MHRQPTGSILHYIQYGAEYTCAGHSPCKHSSVACGLTRGVAFWRLELNYNIGSWCWLVQLLLLGWAFRHGCGIAWGARNRNAQLLSANSTKPKLEAAAAAASAATATAAASTGAVPRAVV